MTQAFSLLNLILLADSIRELSKGWGRKVRAHKKRLRRELAASLRGLRPFGVAGPSGMSPKELLSKIHNEILDSERSEGRTA